MYWRFARGDAKKARMVIDILRPHGSGETTAAGGMVSLCPDCLAILTPRNYQCPACGARFKDEKTLLWRGIVVPGGASLYVGATGLGLFRAVFESALLLAILLSVFRAIRAPTASGAVANLMAAVALECVVLFVDKLMAIWLSLPQVRDFIPVE